MDPWTLAATVAVAAATLGVGAVLAAALVRPALAPGGLGAAQACALVVGSLALGGVLSPLVGGVAAGLAAPLLDGLPDGSSGVATRDGAVVALAGALGPVLAWALWRTVGRRPAPPGLVAALAAAVGALVVLGAPIAWAGVLGRALLAPLAGVLIAALATAALVVLVSWALRHATPEPVHRRSRALAPLTTTLLGIGAGLQAVGVARLLLAPAAPTGPAGLAGLSGLSRSAGWTDLLLAGALALGSAAWLATRLHRENPVRRVPPVHALAGGATGAAVLMVASALGAVVPVRLVVGAGACGAAAVSGQRALSAPLLRLGWSAAALVPVSGLVGLGLGAALGPFV